MFTTATLYSILEAARQIADDLEIKIEGLVGHPLTDSMTGKRTDPETGEEYTPDPLAPNGGAPVPAPQAPISPAPPVQIFTDEYATPAPGVELDDNGIPYDPRIHTGGNDKKMKGQNIWKKKRGVDPALVIQVEAELRAAIVTPVPAATPAPEAPVPAATPAPEEQPPQSPAATPAPEAPAPAPATSLFAQFVTDIATANMESTKLVPVLTKYGFADLSELNAAQACDVLIPVIRGELGL